jgi:hypothetical protein
MIDTVRRSLALVPVLAAWLTVLPAAAWATTVSRDERDNVVIAGAADHHDVAQRRLRPALGAVAFALTLLAAVSVPVVPRASARPPRSLGPRPPRAWHPGAAGFATPRGR